LILPSVVSAEKSGATSPIRTAIVGFSFHQQFFDSQYALSPNMLEVNKSSTGLIVANSATAEYLRAIAHNQEPRFIFRSDFYASSFFFFVSRHSAMLYCWCSLSLLLECEELFAGGQHAGDTHLHVYRKDKCVEEKDCRRDHSSESLRS